MDVFITKKIQNSQMMDVFITKKIQYSQIMDVFITKKIQNSQLMDVLDNKQFKIGQHALKLVTIVFHMKKRNVTIQTLE